MPKEREKVARRWNSSIRVTPKKLKLTLKPSSSPRKPVTPRKPVKKVNPKRKASEFARCFGSKARVALVKAMACTACGNTPSENAHTVGGGAGRKADYQTIAPLCHACHRFQHQHGWTRLEIEFGFDRDLAARQTDRQCRDLLRTNEP